MKLDEKGLLVAMAQVFEDYPERFTEGAFARTLGGDIVEIESDIAHSFCAIGLLKRIEREGSAEKGTADRAVDALGRHINTGSWLQWCVTNLNNHGGRLAVIKMARATAAVI